MNTDTTEKGLEALIVAQMTGQPVALSQPVGFTEDPEPFAGLSSWLRGDPDEYDRGWAVDLVQLRAFIAATQPPLVAALGIDSDSPTRQKFLARLQGETARRGVIDILRNGLKHGPHEIALFYPSPSPGNPKAAERFSQNRFSVTRQLRYSEANANTLDLALFVNGLPIATFELKNSLTKQTVEDAIEQYKRNRDPRENCSSSADASRTLRSMTMRCGSALIYRARALGFCRSTKGGTTAREIHRTPPASPPTICGRRS